MSWKKSDLFVPFGQLIQFEFRRFKGRSRLALFFILIIPLLYGGVYLHANWDLYNHLDRVKIAVVNHDQPASFADKTVSGGRDFEQALRDNPTFGWQFLGTDGAKAERGLHKGDYYAVLAVPQDFSTRLVGAGDYKPARATLSLERDDANGYIIGLLTSKMDDTLAKTLDQSVSQTYFQSLFVNLNTIKSSLSTAAQGAATLDSGLSQAADGVHQMKDQVATAVSDTSGLKPALDSLNGALDDSSASALTLSQAAGQARAGAATIIASGKQLGNDVAGAKDASGAVNDFVDKQLPQLQQDATHLVSITGSLQNPNGNSVISVQSDLAGAKQSAASLLANHPELATDPDYVSLLAQLGGADTANTSVTSNLAVAGQLTAGLNLNLNKDNLAMAGTTLTNALDRAGDTATQVDHGLDQLNGALDTSDKGVKQLNSAMGQATSSGHTLLSAGAGAVSGLNQLSDGLGRLDTAMPQLSNGAATLASGLQKGTDQLPTLSEDQRNTMAEVMASPATVTQTVDNPAGAYGRGLAPMFFSIALWIAGVSIFLVVRTISGRALTGRASPLRITMLGFGPVATVALAASLLMGLTVWVTLGLNPVHPWKFLLLLVVTALAFMAPAYLLRLVFGSPQTAVYLILLILQLPACGGTFPALLLPPIYQKLAVISPMKYSVDAFRVVISGGLNSTYWGALAILVAITVVCLGCIVLMVSRRRRFRITDLHPPMVTSTSTADYAFSVRPR